MLSAHDTVAQKDFEPTLPPLPDNIPENEEAMRIVCLVKNNQPLVHSFLMSVKLLHLTEVLHNVSHAYCCCFFFSLGMSQRLCAYLSSWYRIRESQELLRLESALADHLTLHD